MDCCCCPHAAPFHRPEMQGFSPFGAPKAMSSYGKTACRNGPVQAYPTPSGDTRKGAAGSLRQRETQAARIPLQKETIDFWRLKYLPAVAVDVHSGRAAIRVKMAQPPLSRLIASLGADGGQCAAKSGAASVRRLPARRAGQTQHVQNVISLVSAAHLLRHRAS